MYDFKTFHGSSILDDFMRRNSKTSSSRDKEFNTWASQWFNISTLDNQRVQKFLNLFAEDAVIVND